MMVSIEKANFFRVFVGGLAQLVGASSLMPKGIGFDPG